MRTVMRLAASAIIPVVLALGWRNVGAQERFSLFVGSDPKTIERMLRLAAPRDSETVIDLGSGDGRVVFAAVQANPGVRGVGVDIDKRLIEESTAKAKSLGLAERVRFEHLNAFDADLSGVNVIFMWFFPEMMRLMRVKILEQAQPGTRVVAPLWGFGSWPPDATDKAAPAVSMWIVPAKVGGYWSWRLSVGGVERDYDAIFEQRFQSVEGVVRTGSRYGIFEKSRLRGDELSFVLMMTLQNLGFTRHEFSARVQGETMEGTVRITLPPTLGEADDKPRTVVLPWQAKRSRTSAFFATTGVEAR